MSFLQHPGITNSFVRTSSLSAQSLCKWHVQLAYEHLKKSFILTLLCSAIKFGYQVFVMKFNPATRDEVLFIDKAIQNDAECALEDFNYIGSELIDEEFFCLKSPGGEIVGALLARPQIDFVEIYKIYVLPSFRGRGFGRLIAQKAIDNYKNNGFHEFGIEVISENYLGSWCAFLGGLNLKVTPIPPNKVIAIIND